MTDSTPLSRYRLAPVVDHRMFVLRDPLQRESPLSAGAPALDELLLPGPNGVVLRSAGDLFQPTCDVEVWAAEPPADDGEWDEQAQASFAAPSATICFESIMGRPAGPDIPLPPGGAYQVRAYSGGRGEAMERLTFQQDYTGVEQWLIQIWPNPVEG